MKQFLVCIILVLMAANVQAQSASVSPTRVYFNNNLGESRTKTVFIVNKSDKEQSYQVSFLDFEVTNKKGKPKLMGATDNSHSIAPWISASPSFFTLQGGASKEIKVTLDTPNTPEANSVKWGVMSLKLAREQESPLGEKNKQLGMAIVNTFQIIVYMFQSPPSITEKSADIYDFTSIKGDDKMMIKLATNNTSPSILDCYTYLEYTNLQTGWIKTTAKKRFTLLPGGAKETLFDLPTDIPKGKYSVMGVVDYGSSNEIKAAELEIVVE